jgi:hypothetical protein
MAEDTESKLESYDSELETALFNLVITLCERRKAKMPKNEALLSVKLYLDKLSSGLETLLQEEPNR